jgi:pyridoxamine 5'-phosphate oxidase
MSGVQSAWVLLELLLAGCLVGWLRVVCSGAIFARRKPATRAPRREARETSREDEHESAIALRVPRSQQPMSQCRNQPDVMHRHSHTATQPTTTTTRMTSTTRALSCCRPLNLFRTHIRGDPRAAHTSTFPASVVSTRSCHSVVRTARCKQHQQQSAMNSRGQGERLSSSVAFEDQLATSWRTRLAASIQQSRHVRGGNYVQLATVGVDGKPKNRTVVFRGWLPAVNDDASPAVDSDGQAYEALRMITDSRSLKVQDGMANPHAEIVWWFPASSEQYRIAGKLEFIGGSPPAGSASGASVHVSKRYQELRLEQWQMLSPVAREQFFWDTPRAPFRQQDGDATAASDTTKTKTSVPADIINTPPDTFLLMVLWPDEVKHLSLTTNVALFDSLSVRQQPGDNNPALLLRSWRTLRVNP